MKKLKDYLKALRYSFGLVFRSSGPRILFYTLIVLFGSTLNLLSTFLLKLVLDDLTDLTPMMKTVFLWIFLYALSLVLQHVLESVRSILAQTISQKGAFFYDCEVLEKLAKMPLSFLDSSSGKNMVDHVRYARSFTVQNVVFDAIHLLAQLYSFAVAYVTLARFHLGFSLLFLLLTIPGVVVGHVFERKHEKFRKKTAPDMRKLSYYRFLLSDRGFAKDVRMYDLTEPFKKRYEEERERYITAARRLDRQQIFGMSLIELLKRSGELVFTAFVIYQAVHGRISIGDIALYTGFALTVSGSFVSLLSWGVSTLYYTSEYHGRLFRFLAVTTEENRGGNRPVTAFEELTFDNVCFKYPYSDTYVLKGVSFTLKKGDKLSIVGINGAGKTTIIKLMLGLYEIESGQILLNGYPLSDYRIADVRRHFSALFQTFTQYPLTLRENVALSDAARLDNDEEIRAALQQSGVYDELQSKLANGLDSFMMRDFDDHGTELSKGQWQKVALSRTYFKNASVVIFDEPSAALDAEAEDRIFQNFEKMSQGKTGILISHRISAARMATKIIVLDGGRITEEGSHDELIALGGLYAKLYNLQREKYAMTEVENDA